MKKKYLYQKLPKKKLKNSNIQRKNERKFPDENLKSIRI